MNKVCVLSGKGGVGKSSITASLAVELSKKNSIICADCDVDASNLSIVLGSEPYEEHILSTNKAAKVLMENCIKCGQCAQACYFNAIKWDKEPKIIEEKCEGCGTCEIVCKSEAIYMENVENATLQKSTSRYGFDVVSAQIHMGQGGSGKVVNEVKKLASSYSADIMLLDCPAGVGCPAIAAVNDCDYALLVTEPSKTAMSDMKKALGILRHFKIPTDVIINKADINTEQAEIFAGFLQEQGIDIIHRIDYDETFKNALVSKKPAVEFDGMGEHFEKISYHVLNKLSKFNK